MKPVSRSSYENVEMDERRHEELLGISAERREGEIRKRKEVIRHQNKTP